MSGPATVKNTLFNEVIQENLDFFGKLAIEGEGLEVLEFYNNFESFYEMLPDSEKDKNYGRVFVLRKMIKLRVTVELATVADLDGFSSKDFPTESITGWDSETWNVIREEIVSIQENCIRKDANAGIGEEEDKIIDGSRGRNELYRPDKLLNLITFQGAFSSLRQAIQNQLDDESLMGKPKIKKTIFNKFVNGINDENYDKSVRSALSGLVVSDESTGELELKELQELRESLCGNAVLSLTKTCERIKKKCMMWSKDVFGTPKFDSVFFPEDEDEEEYSDENVNPAISQQETMDAEANAAAILKLREARLNLKKTGKDPKEEMLALASSKTVEAKKSPASVKKAKKSPGPASIQISSSPPVERGEAGYLLKRKDNATSLQFNDSQSPAEDEELSEPDGSAVLSELPQRAVNVKRKRLSTGSDGIKKKKSQEKKYQGRRMWTEVEKQAIREGVRSLGAGQWADIKQRYKTIFEYRTSGQIKDCFRTMTRKGEI